jgi:hypothetical protein
MHGMAILAVAALIVVLGAVALQLGLPRLAERAAAQRLTRGGGHARVHLRAFPATKLLRKRGDSLVVKASGLVAAKGEGNGNGGGLQHLDGFAHVDIQVVGVQLGPLSISRVRLIRDGPGNPYEANVQATVTAASIPLDVSATLVNESGRTRATRVSGSLAGFPAGPLVEALTAALAARF